MQTETIESLQERLDNCISAASMLSACVSSILQDARSSDIADNPVHATIGVALANLEQMRRNLDATIDIHLKAQDSEVVPSGPVLGSSPKRGQIQLEPLYDKWTRDCMTPGKSV